MGYRVFISYSTEDLEYAQLAQQAIEILGFETFLAHKSIGAGDSLRNIRGEVQRCHLLVVLWSESASRSEWVKGEVGAAWGAEKAIIPVMLTEGVALPPYLIDVKYLRAYDRGTKSILELQARVTAHWTRMIERNEKQRAALEAERKRREAESSKKFLVALGVGAAALWAIGKGGQEDSEQDR